MRRTKSSKRAQQVLLSALILFVLSQAGIGLLFDYRWPLLRWPSARKIMGRMASRSSPPEVVFLGSSRSQAAFVEQEVSSLLERDGRLNSAVQALNASVPAGDATAQERVLDAVLTAGAKPRLIVLEASPEFLNWYNFCAGWNAARLVRWEDVPTHLGGLLATSQLARLAAARLLPVYNHREQLWDLALKAPEGPLAPAPVVFGPPEHPASSAPVDWDELLKSQPAPLSAEGRRSVEDSAHAIRTGWLRSYRPVSVNVQALRRAVKRCREAGCEVWLFIPPVGATHRAGYTPEIEAAFRAVLADLDCRVVDCRDWMPDEHFLDCHHLSYEGGKHFTRLFTKRLLSPYWKQSEQVSR